jgi:Zn-dependent membrane protease YugP
VREAFKIWEKISISQEMNLPPYVYTIYQSVFIPLWNEKRIANEKDPYGDYKSLGITRKEITQRYFNTFQSLLDTNKLRVDILRSLETAGLITQEYDPKDKRNAIVLPAVDFEEYSVNDGGVVNHAQIREDIEKVLVDAK